MSVLPVQNEKVQLTIQAGDVWQNGLLMNGQNAVYATSSPVNYSNGIQRTATGAIFCVDATAGMPAGFTWTNGLPFSPLGALCISSGPVATWSNGIPFTASGAVAALFLPPAALDLNLTSGTLDSRVTFTRASGGTRFNSSGVLETVASDVPRFDHDPVTLAPRGLLIEGARTNLLLHSNGFGEAAWTKEASSVVLNAGVGPDGSNSATRLVPNAGTGVLGRVRQIAPSTSGQAYTFTVRAKRAEIPFLRILATGFTGVVNQVWFDLENGVSGNASDATGSIKNIGNGFYECAITFTATATTSSALVFAQAVQGMGVSGFTGDGTSGLFIWGAQLEVGAFASSYIPTTSSQVTRAADVAVMTGTNFSSWYNQSQGTFFVESSAASPVDPGSTRTFLDGFANTSNRILLGYNENNNTRLLGVTAGATVADIRVNRATAASVKMAAAYRIDDFNQATNGVVGEVDTSGVLPTPTALRIGSRTEGTDALVLYGHIRRIAYWNTRLTNAELQSLTS